MADLVLFATLYRALVRHMDFDNLSIRCNLVAAFIIFSHMQANIPSAQIIDRYPSLFRWFDFLQHTVDPAGHYKRVDVRKPKFQRAPAPPAPVAKVGLELAYSNRHD